MPKSTSNSDQAVHDFCDIVHTFSVYDPGKVDNDQAYALRSNSNSDQTVHYFNINENVRWDFIDNVHDVSHAKHSTSDSDQTVHDFDKDESARQDFIDSVHAVSHAKHNASDSDQTVHNNNDKSQTSSVHDPEEIDNDPTYA